MSTSSVPGAKREPVDVERLRELCEKATPGPWYCSYRGDGSGSVRASDDPDWPELIDDGRCPYMRGEVRYEDGLFAAAARTALPTCLDLIEELRAALKEARCWLPLNSTPQARGATCETLFDALVKIDAALENK